MKGQLSAEMLILVAVVLAIVAIAAFQLIGTAKDTSGNIQNQTNRINGLTDQAVKSNEGSYCVSTTDCASDLRCEGSHCVS